MNNSNRKKLFIVRRESGGIGGAEKVAHRFVKAFSKHFDAELIHAGKMINGERIQGTKGPSWLKCLRFAKSVRKFLDKQEDVLILSMERGVPGTIYRAGDGVHKVWMKIKYKNSMKWVFNPINWILPNLEKISVEQSKCVVPNSSMVKAEMLEHYKISCEKINVIHNGYDPSIYYPLGTEARLKLRSKLGMDNNDLNLLFSGSGWERKGLRSALRLLTLIIQKTKRVKLWIAGNGNVNKFRKVAKGFGIDKSITFLGEVGNIASFYQTSDFLILPTKYDPFSNSCLESLACGCPVVTTVKNGASEIISNKVNGVIINENDLDLPVLARQIVQVVKDKKSATEKSSYNFKQFNDDAEKNVFLEILSHVK